MAAEIGAREVGVDHLSPLPERELVHRFSDVDARVVDEDIEPAVSRAHGVDQVRNRGLIRHVHAHGRGVAADALDFPHRVCRLLGVARGDDDVCARACKPARHAKADAAVAAGHYRDSLLEIEHRSP